MTPRSSAPSRRWRRSTTSRPRSSGRTWTRRSGEAALAVRSQVKSSQPCWARVDDPLAEGEPPAVGRGSHADGEVAAPPVLRVVGPDLGADTDSGELALRH